MIIIGRSCITPQIHCEKVTPAARPRCVSLLHLHHDIVVASDQQSSGGPFGRISYGVFDGGVNGAGFSLGVGNLSENLNILH